MIEAHSLDSIIRRMQNDLMNPLISHQRRPVYDYCIGRMTSFNMEHPVTNQTADIRKDRSSKLIGVLFCHPKSPLGKAEIVEHLDYFHERSGEVVDFYCAGYGAYWPSEFHADKSVVTKIDGTEWLFSSKAYNRIRDEIEAETRWEHSGESELVLLVARKTSNGTVKLDFTSAIICKLEQMGKDKAFSSARAFFECIFRMAEKYKGTDPVWALSDKKGIETGGNCLKDSILSLLPKPLGESYQRAEHYVVRDISK
jgi:hypothetical protein